MKLKAFNIKNYRSIKNSGWNFLAYDNITALIGQNESGKTTILEALHSFYNGKIHDDILRSDMTMPQVSCNFDLEGKKIFDLIKPNNIPEKLIKILENKNEFSITREWKQNRSSIIRISDKDVEEFYEAIDNEILNFDKQIRYEISKVVSNSDNVFKEMLTEENEKNKLSNEFNTLIAEYEKIKKKHSKAKKEEEKKMIGTELESLVTILKKKESELNEKNRAFEEKKVIVQNVSEKVRIGKKCLEILDTLDKTKNELDKASFLLNEAQHLYEICSGEKEKRIVSQKVENSRSEYNRVKNQYETLSESASVQKHIVAKVFSGLSYKQAETEALSEVKAEKTFVSAFEIGERLFKVMPVFDFFEDFSSLLPNKIDLEDILLENENAEGYKAAKNFLIVAGLRPEFFREKNHRILKQKIENLNGDITINFQDYWSQSVGKNNKIKISFELEHYEFTTPDKSGKPYLEFWIKDKEERLYPKQRSRGVRWFLSFYLELKATAIENSTKRILLIDEPGLSLHARAQEDVLKVFEDINKHLEIIYCTHSPHLIDVNKLYRILAVQRADHDDENSESIIIDAKSLHNASTDTLSPIYSLMGAKLNGQQFINYQKNVILQDPVTFHYINAMSSIMGMKKDIYFIPAYGLTGLDSIFCILTGWGIDFSLLLFGNGETKEISDKMKKEFFPGEEEKAHKKVKIIEKFCFVENLFSTIDFKKYILAKRVGITESNSEYIQNNNLSRIILASSFISNVQNNSVKFSDFDEETCHNFTYLFDIIKNMIE